MGNNKPIGVAYADPDLDSLTVSGLAALTSVTISGDLAITGDITVDDLTIGDDLIVGDALTVGGNVTSQQNVENTAVVRTYNNGIVETSLRLGRAKGTIASPLSVVDTNNIGGFYLQGYANGGWRSTAAVLGLVDGVVSGSNVPGNLKFYTATSAGTLTLGLTIDAAQKATFPGVVDVTGGLSISGTAMTSSAAELNLIDGSIAGTAVASKALVQGANYETSRLALPVGGLYVGAGAGTATTMSAAELNSLTDEIASMTTTATPASGSNGVQFVFKNAAGATVSAARRTFQCFVSTSTGQFASAVTSIAVLTNGELITLVTGQVATVQCVSGLLGVTLTAAAPGSYYLSFVLPNGTVITSSVLTVS